MFCMFFFLSFEESGTILYAVTASVRVNNTPDDFLHHENMPI